MKEKLKDMQGHNKPPSAYKQAGVDIDAADELIESIKPAVGNTSRAGMMSGLGGFGALFDPKAAGYEDPILVSSTDGVGTKIKIAIDADVHNTIGIDAVAMCVNDLVVQGAEPLFFLDYFATGRLDKAVGKEVIEGVAKGCEIAGCALIGGEIAEMPGLYADGDYDLAGFTVGAVNRDELINGQAIQPGDVVLALSSNGVHSNGYSLVRKILSDNDLEYSGRVPFEMNVATQDKEFEKQTLNRAETLADAMLAPTRIYVRSLLKAFDVKDAGGKPAIKGMAHITGGGLSENIPRVLPEGLSASIDASAWELPEIFKWLKSAGKLDNDDLVRTLNCGLGMIVVCDAQYVKDITATLEDCGETVFEIGKIIPQKQPEISFMIKNRKAAWG